MAICAQKDILKHTFKDRNSHTSSNLLTKEICPAPSKLNKSGTHPCPPAIIVLGEIQMQDSKGKNWVFSLCVAMSLVASATEMLESWPTQANLFPSAEKLTE